MDLVGGPAAADAVGVASRQQAGRDGDGTDGHGRGDAEKPGAYG